MLLWVGVGGDGASRARVWWIKGEEGFTMDCVRERWRETGEQGQRAVIEEGATAEPFDQRCASKTADLLARHLPSSHDT